MRRYIFPLVTGIVGVAILVSLGVWQLRRLAWKEELLATISTRISAPPVTLASLSAPDPARDQYQAITAEGRTTGQEARVLTGSKTEGPGFEIITPFETDGGRRILLDRGFVPDSARNDQRPATALRVAGNLEWPNEVTGSTPPPDLASGLWFARDLSAMARALGTEPVLLVVRTAEGEPQGIAPMPVDTAGIPNDHLNYAITWFSLAAVWAGMTVYLLWRIRQRTA